MYNSLIANQENPTFTQKKATPVVQILNIILWKVIQIDKPTGYYGDREKTKIFIY